MDRAAVLDHEFLIAAYTVTWIVQLSYLAWVGFRWRAESRAARRREHPGR